MQVSIGNTREESRMLVKLGCINVGIDVEPRHILRHYKILQNVDKRKNNNGMTTTSYKETRTPAFEKLSRKTEDSSCLGRDMHTTPQATGYECGCCNTEPRGVATCMFPYMNDILCSNLYVEYSNDR